MTEVKRARRLLARRAMAFRFITTRSRRDGAGDVRLYANSDAVSLSCCFMVYGASRHEYLR